MVYLKQEVIKNAEIEIIKLTEQYVGQMLELTKLTNPGPFLSKTIRLGNYEGIFHEGKLVAMAGQRFHSANYVEISAVCTHPDHLGKGFARQLIMSQIYSIQAQNEIPYLHVRIDNQRAIQIYNSMGFETRSEMIIYILSKK